MANRTAQSFQLSMLKGVFYLQGAVNIGAAGAPTLQKWNPVTVNRSTPIYTAAPTVQSGAFLPNMSLGEQGIKSITRVSAGVYNVLLQDTYQRLLDFRAVFSNVTGLPTTISTGLWASTDVTTIGTGIKFTTLSASGVAADPASGDVMLFSLLLQNSTAI